MAGGLIIGAMNRLGVHGFSTRVHALTEIYTAAGPALDKS